MVVCGVLAAAFAPAARADLLGLGGGVSTVVGGLTGAPGTTAPSLNAVFNSPNEGSLLASVGCPIAKALPSPPVPSQVASVICALKVLNYAYRTVYVQADGTKLTRITRAVAITPTPIDVNGDGVPDFTGIVLPGLSGTSLTLDIQRLAGFSASAKVSIEAIALDPAAGQTYIGAGEDGLSAGTDQDWSATVTFLSASTAGTQVSVTQTNSGAPSTIATLGEIFSGSNPDAPTNVWRGDVSFTPAPASLTTDVKLGGSSQEATVTSSVSSLVQANVNLISPGDEKDITATVNKLGKSTHIAYAQPSDGETNVAYTGDAPINQLSGQYHDLVNGSLATAAAVDATIVPTGLTVDQVGAHTTVATSGGAIGLIEARYGSGTDVPAAASVTGAYVAYHGNADGSLTAGARLPNLQKLTLNAAQPFSGDLTLTAPLSYIGLSGQDDAKGISVTGHLKNLPQHTTVGIDLGGGGGGKVTFDGHGTGIDEISATATHANGTGAFFDRATRIDATINGIPAADTVKFAYSTTGGGSTAPKTTQASASASAPIGSIAVLASDGSDAPAVTGSGVWYTDTQSSYNAFARINGLTGYSVSLTTDPVSNSVKALRGSLDTASQNVGCQPATGAGQDATVYAKTDSGTFNGTIHALPSSVTFSMGPNTGGDEVVDYQASAPIAKITADAKGFSLGIPHATTLHGEISCLPSRMTLTIPAQGGKITFNTYGSHIGHVLAQIYGASGAATYKTGGFQAGNQLAFYDQATSQLTLDLNNVGGFDASQGASPLTLDYDISSQKELDVEVIHGLLLFKSAISTPQPAGITMTPGSGSINLTYNANGQSSNFTNGGQVDSLALETNLGGTDWLQGTLTNVPAKLGICLRYSPGDLTSDCVPGWVQGDVAISGKSVPNKTDFAIDITPADLSGHVPSTPLTFTGQFCALASGPLECDGITGGQSGLTGVVVSNLTFNILNAAFGQQTDDCHASIACGRAWVTLNTNDRPVTGAQDLSGQVTYYQGGSPFVSFNAPTGSDPSNPGSFVTADQFFYFVQYNLGVTDSPVDTWQTSRQPTEPNEFDCGHNPPPSLNLAVGPGIDLLNGTHFGLCP